MTMSQSESIQNKQTASSCVDTPNDGSKLKRILLREGSPSPTLSAATSQHGPLPPKKHYTNVESRLQILESKVVKLIEADDQYKRHLAYLLNKGATSQPEFHPANLQQQPMYCGPLGHMSQQQHNPGNHMPVQYMVVPVPGQQPNVSFR